VVVEIAAAAVVAKPNPYTQANGIYVSSYNTQNVYSGTRG